MSPALRVTTAVEASIISSTTVACFLEHLPNDFVHICIVGADHTHHTGSVLQDMLTQMVFLERNLENIGGKEIEGRVESHLCVITNAEKALTIYDDYDCVCSIKPVDAYTASPSAPLGKKSIHGCSSVHVGWWGRADRV